MQYLVDIMTHISLARLYELLAGKVGKETAENLTTFIEEKIKEEVENKSQRLATRDDLARVELKITDSKVELMRWMFALWVTLALMIIGLYLKK